MFKKILSSFVILCFSFSLITFPSKAHANSVLGLPEPGTMVNLSPAYEPVLIKGLTIHKDNPFLFDFIVDTGHSQLTASDPQLKIEADRLIKYFFACLTIPEKDLWVNLSPYEKNRMVPQALGQTAMGRDLLAEDYILKQLTASLIYPEKNLGKEFWNRVYAKAQQLYGTTQIPVNTFNKVWILADKATVYEHGQTAFVVGGHLKVMLEEDYLALQKHMPVHNGTDSIGANIVRAIVLPEIEKEVNQGQNFAQLRQIFNSLILASWYKKNLKEALLNQVYADHSTVSGVNLKDPSAKEQIYQQYLKAYKKGVFNYIKEDPQADGQIIPRKYFSGGFGAKVDLAVLTDATAKGADISRTTPTGSAGFVDFSVLAGMNEALPTQGPDTAMIGTAVDLNQLAGKLLAAWSLAQTLKQTDPEEIKKVATTKINSFLQEVKSALSKESLADVWAAQALRGMLEGVTVDNILSTLKPESINGQIMRIREEMVLLQTAKRIPGDPEAIVLRLYNKVPQAARVDIDKIDEAKAQQIREQLENAVNKLSMMINFKGSSGHIPSKQEILGSLVGTSVLHPELVKGNIQEKFGVGQDIPPTFVFDGRIFVTYPGQVKPYRIALTLGKDFLAVTTTYADLPDYEKFTIWSQKGLLSSNFDPERFLLAKGGDRVYKLGRDLKGSLEDKLSGNGTKPILQEAVDLARGMGEKNPLADVFFEGGKTTFILNQDADPQEATKAWVTSSILAGVLGRLYDAGPDMNSADLMGVLQAQADRVHAVLALPQVPVTTSIAGEPASFDHYKWTVTSISAFESFMVVFQDEWIKKRYNIKPNIDLVIQGFGDVGSGLVQYINDRYSAWIADGRIRIVAVADMNGGIYDPQGLDVKELLRLRNARSQSVRSDYQIPVDRKVKQFEKGSEVFFVRSNYPEVKADDTEKRSVIAFPAAGPGVFTSREDIGRLKEAGVSMVVSPANNPLKEDVGLENVFEEGDKKILYLGPSSVSFGGIYTSTEEIFHILYEGGMARLREKVNGGAEEWQAHIQDGIVGLTMSLINIEKEQFKREIQAGTTTTFYNIHAELAAKVRKNKNFILSDPDMPLFNRIASEVKAVFNLYAKNGDPLTSDRKDAIALVIILSRVVEEARARAIYDPKSVNAQVNVLDAMLNNPQSVSEFDQRIAIYELGKMAVVAARVKLLRIITDVRFDVPIKVSAAEALINIGKKGDLPLLRAVAKRTNSPSLRFWCNWAANRIEKTVDSAMTSPVVQKMVNRIEEANTREGVNGILGEYPQYQNHRRVVEAAKRRVTQFKTGQEVVASTISTDHALVTNGGIDLNTINMGMTVTKDANGGVQINFDQAMIARIKLKGVQSVVPVIINITSVADIRPLLGLPTGT